MFFIVGMLELYNAKMPASTVKKICPTSALAQFVFSYDWQQDN